MGIMSRELEQNVLNKIWPENSHYLQLKTWILQLHLNCAANAAANVIIIQSVDIPVDQNTPPKDPQNVFSIVEP